MNNLQKNFSINPPTDVLPDNVYNADESDWKYQEFEKKKQEVERAKQEVERIKSNTEERKKMAKWVKYVIPSWLGITAGIISSVGMELFELSEVVLCTLLGTTTVNVLGLGYIVLKGLFPNDNEKLTEK